MVEAIFLIMNLRYLCKSIVKIIDFITPWDGDFLRLDFLIYIFGYEFKDQKYFIELVKSFESLFTI